MEQVGTSWRKGLFTKALNAQRDANDGEYK